MMRTAIILVLSASGALGQRLPPALPEPEWVGKTNVNYTQLHNEHGHLLLCMYIPVGVLGFYVWFLMIPWLVFIAFRMSTASRSSAAGTAVSLVSLAYGVFILYWNCRTIRTCTGPLLIRGTALGGIVSSIFAVLGGLTALFRHTQDHFKKVAIGLMIAAVAVHVTVAPLYFMVVSRTLEAKLRFDLVQVRASLVVYGPAFVICLVLTLVALYKFRTLAGLVSIKRFRVAVIPFIMIGAFILAASCFLYGTGTLFLGKIVGDTWGTYIVQRGIGVYWAVFATVMPFFEGVLTVVTGVSGA